MTITITALEAQQHSKDRVNVYLDGTFAFGLTIDVAARLRVGMQLTDTEVATLQSAEVQARAHQKALDYLSYRPRTEAELRRYLTERGFPEAVIGEVLERLREVALVDDAAFARLWVANRAQLRPKGTRALTQELRQKGVAAETIAAALAEYDEVAAAQTVVADQVRRLAHVPPELQRRRLVARLARRGFSFDVIQDLLAAELFSDAEEML